MTKKTVKTLDAELINLKSEFEALKTKCDELSEKYTTLENKSVGKYQIKNVELKCETCDQQFNQISDLKKHAKTHNLRRGPFECKTCERSFNEEWKLEAHIKTYKLYSCEECDKQFKNQDTKEKHVDIAHGNSKLYCCFFNNGVECLFNTECVFLHEHSGPCKFGKKCERINCMFQHKTDENKDARDDTSNKDDDNDDIVEIKIGKEKNDKIVDIDNDFNEEQDDDDNDLVDCDDTLDRTFRNPSQSKNPKIQTTVKTVLS